MSNPNDYEDLSIFEDFHGEVQAENERNMQEGDENRDPIWYLDNKNRTYKLRFAPEMAKDPETGRSKLVFNRTVWSHSGFEKVPRLPCKGRDCPICKEVNKLKDAKYADVWKFKARREELVRAWIFESTAPKEYKYLKTGEFGFIALRDKVFKSLNSFLADLNPQELKDVLVPIHEAPRIRLTLTPGSDGSASWGFDIKKAALPPLPTDYKSVNDVYVQDDAEITDEHLRSIRTQINKILMSLGSGEMMDPDEGDDGAGAPPPQAQRPRSAGGTAAKDAVRQALGKSSDTPAASHTGSHTRPITFVCPGAAEGLEFGQNPQAKGGEMNPACLVCPKEEECLLASS